MTAFEHAVFGPSAQALAVDTFLFTKCAPQAREFNETGNWRQIEKRTAANGAGRLCFFNGAIFDAPVSDPGPGKEDTLRPRGAREPDPVLNGLAIPEQGFKIAVYDVEGQLTVQSFRGDPGRAVEEARVRR